MSFKAISFSFRPLFFTFIFALYNGFLGTRYQSSWYSSICMYYILLVVLRALFLLTEKRRASLSKDPLKTIEKRTFYATSAILILMNFALAVSITLMVYHQRPVHISMIPAIAIATYTTYKVILACVNFKKIKNCSKFIRELRTINFIDALLSILTLQNTLITVNGSENSHDMFVLSAITSAVILLIIAGLSLRMIIKGKRSLAEQND